MIVLNISEGAIVLFIALAIYLLAVVWYEITDAFASWKKRRKEK